MRRSLLLTKFVWIIILLSGCSFTDQGGNQNTNNAGRANFNVTERVDFDEKPPNNLTENDIKGIIRAASRKMRLGPLTKSARRNGFELRLWINLGLVDDEKLLIVRTGESRNYAYFYQFLETADALRRSPIEILADPQNGWSNLQSEVSNRLATPKRLVLDPQFHITRHEGLISLEVVEKAEYQFVYYGHHSSFDDAMRLINLCEYLSGEFGVDIDCRGKRTTLGPIR
jgi:hypothetical protein